MPGLSVRATNTLKTQPTMGWQPVLQSVLRGKPVRHKIRASLTYLCIIMSFISLQGMTVVLAKGQNVTVTHGRLREKHEQTVKKGKQGKIVSFTKVGAKVECEVQVREKPHGLYRCAFVCYRAG